MRPLGSLERQRGSIGRVLDLELGLTAFDVQTSQFGRLIRKPDPSKAGLFDDKFLALFGYLNRLS